MLPLFNQLNPITLEKILASKILANFESNHPRSQKIGMITGLLDRMVRSSNGEHWEKIIKLLIIIYC